MVNIKKIKALMGANDHTNKYIAKVLGISNTALKNKLTQKSEFKASELKTLSDVYAVSVDELYE